jgi:hypothetical protein
MIGVGFVLLAATPRFTDFLTLHDFNLYPIGVLSVILLIGGYGLPAFIYVYQQVGRSTDKISFLLLFWKLIGVASLIACFYSLYATLLIRTPQHEYSFI